MCILFSACGTYNTHLHSRHTTHTQIHFVMWVEGKRVESKPSARACEGDDERKSSHKTLWKKQQKRRRRWQQPWHQQQKSINEIRGEKFIHFVCKRSVVHYSVCAFPKVFSASLSVLLRSLFLVGKITHWHACLHVCVRPYSHLMQYNSQWYWFVVDSVASHSMRIIHHSHKVWSCKVNKFLWWILLCTDMMALYINTNDRQSCVKQKCEETIDFLLNYFVLFCSIRCWHRKTFRSTHMSRESIQTQAHNSIKVICIWH